MTAATMTFDQVEANADRTLAFVLWAKNAKNVAMAAMLMALLDQTAKGLVKSLSHNDLASISDEQAIELAKRLHEINSELDFLLRRNTVVQWRSKFLFSGSVSGLEDSTENLSDIIEDLMLSTNQDFRSLIGECVRALPSKKSVELVGRM